MRKPLNLNVLLSKNERYTTHRQGKEIQKDLSHLLDLRVSWVSAAAPDLWPPLIRADAPDLTGWRHAEDRGTPRSYWIAGLKTKGKLRNLTHKNRSQLRYTLHYYKQKWTVVEGLNLKVYFLFIYSDINYITTTREIKNSSFFVHDVSNCRKGRKVTKTGVD